MNTLSGVFFAYQPVREGDGRERKRTLIIISVSVCRRSRSNQRNVSPIKASHVIKRCDGDFLKNKVESGWKSGVGVELKRHLKIFFFLWGRGVPQSSQLEKLFDLVRRY